MCISGIVWRSVMGGGDARLNSHFDWSTTGSESKPGVDRSKHIYSVIWLYRLNKLIFLEKSKRKIKRSIPCCVVLNLAAINWYSISVFKHTNYLTWELGPGENILSFCYQYNSKVAVIINIGYKHSISHILHEGRPTDSVKTFFKLHILYLCLICA